MTSRTDLGGKLALLVAVLTCGPSAAPAAAASDPAPRCQIAKLSAAVAEVRALLHCARAGAAPICTTRARGRRDTAFARAEARGGCATTADSNAIGAQVATLVAALTVELQPGGPAPSRCTSAQFAAGARLASNLGKIYLHDERYPDPSHLAADLAAARSRFASAFARAVAMGDCLGAGAAGQSWSIVSSGIAGIVAALFPVPVQCPCWTSAALDAAFPAGFFDASGRGGAECNFPSIIASINAADTCTLFGPVGMNFTFARGGAAVVNTSACVLFADLDPDDNGTCNEPPTVLGTTAEQSAACVVTLQASQIYQSECP